MNDNRPTSCDPAGPADQIARKTRGEIEVFLQSVGRSDIYEGMRNLSQNISDDYGDRFLVELIQNGHDAHAHECRDGEISILLDETEGEFGSLYVANRGTGFEEKNFKSICNIALSSKPINEGIGNKGLGFRSVLQICQWPEIYSSLAASPGTTFNGYCFRFASESDVRMVLRQLDQEDKTNTVWQKMPRLFLPVLAEDRPGRVAEFGRDGFATVVRLPLDSEAARNSVVEQFDWIASLVVPLQLFLERLACIRLRRTTNDLDVTHRRFVEKNKKLSNQSSVQHVRVGSEMYLVAERALPESTFRAQLEASVAKRQIPETWLAWSGVPQISVAVRLGQPVAGGRLYCFLPLGEQGRAPFAGHINANFYTQMDRRSVHAHCELNDFFISSAASLILEIITFLVAENDVHAPGAVSDLLCWSGEHAGKMILQLLKPKALDREFLPALSTTGAFRWSTPRESCVWDSERYGCITADKLVRAADVSILLPSLGVNRIKSLKEFFASMSIRLEPSPDIVAQWVEKLAQGMLRDQVDAVQWDMFYRDIARFFVDQPKPLFGRQFLLCGDGQLHKTEETAEGRRTRRAGADIYFPPVQGQDLESERDEKSILTTPLPEALQPRFNFVRADLEWLDADRKQTNARQYLAKHRFVREYDSRELLRTLADLSRDRDASDLARRTALEWGYRICTSGRALADKEIFEAGFAVPTRGGWRPATEAMFGEGWQTRNGRALEKLLRDSRDFSSELHDARYRLLPQFKEWGFVIGAELDWIHFLQAAGVRDRLLPFSRTNLSGVCQGSVLAHTIRSLPSAIKFSDPWMDEINRLARDIANQYTDYRYEGGLWVIPGQDDLPKLPTDTRRDYAIQLIRMSPILLESHWSFRVYRPRPTQRNEQNWPTPLAIFFKSGKWLPVGRSSSPLWRYVAPDAAWLFQVEPGMPNPRFLDLVDPRCAEACQEADVLPILKNRCGIGVLTDPDSAPRFITLLGNVAWEKTVEERDVGRFRELYSDAWNTCVANHQEIVPNYMPVLCNGAIAAIRHNEPSAGESKGDTSVGYFADEENSLKKLLLAGVGRPIFDFEMQNKADSWALLSKVAPKSFVKISGVSLDVLCDDERFLPSDAPPLLKKYFGPWVVDYLVMAAENKGGAFFRKTQKNLADLKRRLERLRLVVCTDITVRVDNHVQGLPDDMGGRMVLDDEAWPTLVTELGVHEFPRDLLCRIGDSLAQAIKQRQLGSAFEAALLQLVRVIGQPSDLNPSDEEMARALGTTVERISMTRQEASGDPVHILSMVRLLAIVFGIVDPVSESGLVGVSDVSEFAMNECLAPLAVAMRRSVQQLTDDLRLVVEPRDLLVDRFGVKLADLNRAIRELGQIYPTVSNKERHQQRFRGFITEESDWINSRLRWGFLPVFDRHEDLNTYVQLREFNKLEPDSEWFETLDDLTDKIMRSRIAAWFSSVGITVDDAAIDIEPLEVVREKNRESLRKFADRFGPLVPLWSSSNQSPLSSDSVWKQPSGSKQALIKRAMQGGWIDFRNLDESEIVTWLGKCNDWPKDMPVSTDLSVLGLTTDDLGDAERKARAEAEEKRRRRSSIQFAGKDMSALESDYQELVTALRGALSQVADKLGSGADLALEDVSIPPKKRRGEPGGGGGKPREPRNPDAAFSDEQRIAVGLIGELWAFEWIKAHHRAENGIDVTTDSWVSSYRGRALGTAMPADADKLGFDFKVELSQTTYYYEVKASSGDPEMIELGPTEISAALRYRRDTRNKYRILYVASALLPASLRFVVLQNPYSSKGEKKLRIVGGGSVKYRFHRLETEH